MNEDVLETSIPKNEVLFVYLKIVSRNINPLQCNLKPSVGAGLSSCEVRVVFKKGN